MDGATLAFGYPNCTQAHGGWCRTPDQHNWSNMAQGMGYFPIVSLVVGVARIIFASILMVKSENAKERYYLGAHIARGFIEVIQLGLVLAIVDAVVAHVRKDTSEENIVYHNTKNIDVNSEDSSDESINKSGEFEDSDSD